MRTLLLLPLVACQGKDTNPSGDWALRFSGSDCVSVDLDDDAYSAALTVELWVAGETLRTDGHQPLVFWTGNFGLVELEDGTTWFGDSELGDGAPSTASISDDSWHHVAGVRDEVGRHSLFVDGQLRSFATPVPGSPGASLTIGCSRALDVFFQGAIDELRLSSAARYDADFEPTSPPYDLDDDTTALWHFDDGEGETLSDEAGAYPGTLHGATWIPTDDIEG